jgi:hypothetical protein
MTVTDSHTNEAPAATPAGAHHLVATFCTSEQMDLWRQVFAEADHRARGNLAVNTVNRAEWHQRCA